MIWPRALPPRLPRGYGWLPPRDGRHRLVTPEGRILQLRDVEIEWLRLRMRVDTQHLTDAVRAWQATR